MKSVYLSDDQGRLKKIADTTPNAAEGIDEQLSLDSTNPVQNKVITSALNEINKAIEDIPDTVLNTHYTKNETDNKVNNNVNVKFAESERQKSETEGAIVHEKDVADVEHVETVYDKNSSDSAINWGYTSGLATNIDIQHNFNKYKKLLIYYVVKDGVYSFEKCFKMDLTENVSGVGFVVTQSEKNPYGWMADIAAFNEYYFVRCTVGINKSLINVEFKKGTSNGISVSTVSEIYKIEGVY
jgi:hypothetical protein